MAIAQAAPEFTNAVRGYDRLQVDDYVGHLVAWLDEATDRARGAERRGDALAEECAHLRARVDELESRQARSNAEQTTREPDRIYALRQTRARLASDLRQVQETITSALLDTEASVRRDRAVIDLRDDRDARADWDFRDDGFADDDGPIVDRWAVTRSLHTRTVKETA